MLIDFTAQNFRSIKDTVELSAIAHHTKSSERTHAETGSVPEEDMGLPYVVRSWNLSLLPVLGIFGANASGKSNVLLAMSTLFGHMSGLPDLTPGVYGGLVPFLLDTSSHLELTRFGVRLAFGDNVYDYAMHLRPQKVHYESLSYAPAETKKDRLLYSRTWNSARGGYDWKNGDHFAGPHRLLQASLKESESFMSLLLRLEVPVVQPVAQWLNQQVVGIGHGYERLDQIGAEEHAISAPEHLERISALVRLFDTGIERFEVVRQKQDNQPASEYKTSAVHTTPRGEVKFPLFFESAGTRRLFQLANNVLKTFDHGTLLLIDELGSNIHPNITRTLVQMFQSPQINPKRAQLIFTSHDNTLQRGRLLRRDQIWFTEKSEDGSTRLYPLTDFRPRKESAVDKSYLDGRYGAVPLLPEEDELAVITTGHSYAR